jgi:hypothetical protein
VRMSWPRPRRCRRQRGAEGVSDRAGPGSHLRSLLSALGIYARESDARTGCSIPEEVCCSSTRRSAKDEGVPPVLWRRFSAAPR